MEKVIWVIDSDRKAMLSAQRSINSTGSMRAFCLLSYSAVERAVQAKDVDNWGDKNIPSLIVMDYRTAVAEDFQSISLLKKQQAFAGVPLFFMTEKRSEETDEECFERGAMVVLQKPFTKSGILRLERMAWQHEVTRNYEKVLQKQAGDLQAAREIMNLNKQLKSRNKLLYQVFGRYFSDQVMELILEHPESAAVGGEKKELTVMMADLRGFTSISEELEPEAMTQLLNFYFGKMVEVISNYRGTVIEFLGDGVLAVFGAPLISEDQTADAVAAGIAMQNCMGEVNAYCEQQGYSLLEMGIGIHRGEAFIGNVGSKKMMRYNVIGGVVNECSRIESFSVGGQVLVSREALDTISCPVEVHDRMAIMAKGVHKPVTVCEVIGIGGSYQCSIGNVEFDALKAVDKWTVFNLYRIEGKRVSGEPVSTLLMQFSRKRAVVELLDNEEERTKEQPVQSDILADGEKDNSRGGTQLELYSDVEIFAAGKDGRAIFNGVYAKVVKCSGQELILHFTHINQSFQKFADEIC
ncbi:MAG: adenylate/guanylate cyclase domain-containing response regulator [Lachnospiraceae bacterium]|nr:adenylate/guanylate cyclase domain-containing response regulator [Lachnospiraceae bacterium]